MPPGETPPGESSVTGLSHQEAPPGRGITPVALIAIGVLLLLVIAFVVAKAASLF